jgi:hypothetical protein
MWFGLGRIGWRFLPGFRVHQPSQQAPSRRNTRLYALSNRLLVHVIGMESDDMLGAVLSSRQSLLPRYLKHEVGTVDMTLVHRSRYMPQRHVIILPISEQTIHHGTTIYKLRPAQ